jgi:hydrogenase expression/formation protein HypC
MCLGIPGKITELYQQDGLLMGRVDFGGALREVCLSYIPEAKAGEYVVVHVGFAISLLSEEEAQLTLQTLQELFDLQEELGEQASPGADNLAGSPAD